MQQTAVEWLFEQLWNTPKDKLNWYAILQQAKEMEKQQTEISDEEIEKGAREWYDKEGRYKPSAIALKTWGYAIKWYREQLKQPKKD
jgi:uncharacterized protein (UPF0248 family)